jgi:small subunit ribosomal protein S6
MPMIPAVQASALRIPLDATAATLRRLPASPRVAAPGRRTGGEAASDRRKEIQGDVNEYEILLLLDPDSSEDKQTEVVGRVRDLIEKAGGTWERHDVWGRRKLAYEIDHKGDGSYHLLLFASAPDTLDEVARVLKIDDTVMRHMATRRLQGGPAEPVAVGAPTSEDADTAPTSEEEEE